jgi:6-phosphogluconate dehydrogenase
MRAAAKEYGWNLNYGGIALMWRGGCIIRSRFLGDIKKAFDQNPHLTNLLLDAFFQQGDQKMPAGVARCRSHSGEEGDPGPGIQYGASILRRFPQRSIAGQPSPGAARLFWRPHVRARR